MLLEPSADQQSLRETTEKFLRAKVPVATVRTLRDDAAGFDRDYWRRGVELGWTALLVSEEHGGGSVSGKGLVDLTLVAHEFGRAAAPGPLVPTSIVAGALSAGGAHEDIIEGILTGEAIATWCLAEAPPNGGLGTVTLQITVDGDELVLNGAKRPVESGAQGSDGTPSIITPKRPSTANKPDAHHPTLMKILWEGASENP